MPTAQNQEILHRSAVRDVAAARFNFPNDEFADLQTFVNLPDAPSNMSITGEKSQLLPDIVVVRNPGQWFVMSAEVEIRSTVTEEAAQNDWLPMSRVGDFFLFVPVGCADEAMDLCRRFGVELDGLRTYRYRPVWGLEVNDLWPYPAGPLREPPLAGLLKRFLGS